jgi:hypothetical protein
LRPQISGGKSSKFGGSNADDPEDAMNEWMDLRGYDDCFFFVTVGEADAEQRSRAQPPRDVRWKIVPTKSAWDLTFRITNEPADTPANE